MFSGERVAVRVRFGLSPVFCALSSSRNLLGGIVKKTACLLLTATVLAACARSEAIRTSGNTVMIQTSAAPVCGAQGAARVAANMAAIETIKAGFDSYIIMGGAAANNVTTTQMPGQYQTHGNLTYGRGYGAYNATTTYTPGPVIVSGSHDQSLAVRMFKQGEPGSENAIPAKATLGPEWEEKVKYGALTCLK